VAEKTTFSFLKYFMKLQALLETILPVNRIKTRLIDVMAYANDAGFYHLIPKAVVQPISVQEVKQLFQLSHQQKIPLVFRAGGTSLSGQSITDGILVDIGKHWRGIEPLENGKLVKVQPGIIGSMVNAYLKPYKRKIGPDPSSITAAMMGGILSNNSSGMCCGVAYNSYHTMQSIHFVLPNGNNYNTADNNSYDLFLQQDAVLANTIIQLQKRIVDNQDLYNKIRKKYQTKNTVGYGLNAFIDYQHPLDIVAHLLIGAEGTLGFIASAVMQTLPSLPHTATAMLYFNSIYEACASIIPLKNTNADVLELMDRASLKSVENLKGLPDFFKDLPSTAACILCEYQAESKTELQAKIKQFNTVANELQLLHPVSFTSDEKTRDFYWKIRKGMFPSVGAVRAKGTTVLLEDIAFPLENLADAVVELQDLFKEFEYHDAIIFGHAKDGNIHFVVTQLLDSEAEINRYDTFMKTIVHMVLNKYDGTLKAEHGTGRNMAPFVEAEWGGVAYEIMQTLKQTIDPNNLLNPGVIINTDKNAHIKNLKQMPVVEEEVDKCIECGYCEPNCPSRDVTLTPRQRIQVRRQLQRFEKEGNKADYKTLLQQYQYDGLDTCATDGLCQSDCPVQINTGELVKRLRKEQHHAFSNNVALFVAKNFRLVETSTRFLIHSAVTLNQLFGKNFIRNTTAAIKKIVPSFPLWMNEMGKAPKQLINTPSQPQVVYFTACLHRVMGNQHGGKSLQQAFLDVCAKANIQVLLPKEITGHCCGQPFSSKGFLAAARHTEEKTIDALIEWTNNGQIPVVCDFTSCTYTLLHNQSFFTEAYKQKFAKITWIDTTEFLRKTVLPQLPIQQSKKEIVLHPVCSAKKLYLDDDFKAIAQACSQQVIIPKYAGCCGMAGDRGFLVPDLTESATALEIAEIKEKQCDGFYSSGKTCEMAMSHYSGKNYEHIVHLLDEVSG